MLKPVHNSKLASPVSTEVFGAPIFNYIHTHPELGPVFDAGVSSLNSYETAGMLDAYRSFPCAIAEGSTHSYKAFAGGTRPRLPGDIFGARTFDSHRTLTSDFADNPGFSRPSALKS